MAESGGTLVAVSIPTHRRQRDVFHLLRSSYHRLVKSFSQIKPKPAATQWKSLVLDSDPETETCPDLMDGFQWTKHV